MDCVFHLAGKAHALQELGETERDYASINTEGTRSLLEAARDAGVRRFVYFSSIKVINEGGEEVYDESTPCHPRSAYGRSKLMAEELVLNGGYVPEPVVLRPCMVYGAGQKGNLERMIKAVAEHRFPPLPESGAKRSMVHVDDVVQAAILAAIRPEAAGNCYIVSDEQFYATREIYAWICESLNRTLPVWHVPSVVLRVLARIADIAELAMRRRLPFDSAAYERLTSSAMYSSRKLAEQLGYVPRFQLKAVMPELVAEYLDKPYHAK
jgi:nucleoside-diphosphate-sugar epimerase